MGDTRTNVAVSMGAESSLPLLIQYTTGPSFDDIQVSTSVSNDPVPAIHLEL